MKNLKIAFSLVLLSGLFSFGVMAQGNSGNHDISVEFNEIAILDVVSPSGNQNITLTGDWDAGSLTPGEEITVNTPLDSNKVNRLHYTVFSPQGGNSTYEISVSSGGWTGAGWTIGLDLEPGTFGNPNASGTNAAIADMRGTSASTQLVSDIHKIAWTGTDVSASGWQLNYVLKVTDFDTFAEPTGPVTVTYTISEDI
jgi:hypothetical protein